MPYAQSLETLGTWLALLVSELREFAESRGLAVPQFVIRSSHPTRRALPTAKAVAKGWEVYPPECSDAKVWEIHVHPKESAPRVIVHAALCGLASVIAGPDVKFGDDYGKVAERLGLKRAKAPGAANESWRTPVVDPESQLAVFAIADKLGAFPLAAMDANRLDRKGKDRNSLKAFCPTCKVTTVRMSKKALETLRVFCGGPIKFPHEPQRLSLAQADAPAQPETPKPTPQAPKSQHKPQAAPAV